MKKQLKNLITDVQYVIHVCFIYIIKSESDKKENVCNKYRKWMKIKYLVLIYYVIYIYVNEMNNAIQ